MSNEEHPVIHSSWSRTRCRIADRLAEWFYPKVLQGGPIGPFSNINDNVTCPKCRQRIADEIKSLNEERAEQDRRMMLMFEGGKER